MKKFSLENIVLLIIAFFAIQTCFSQLSKTHYIPPLTAADEGSSKPGDQYIYISTPSLTDVTFTILRKSPLGLPIYDSGIVSNTSPQRVDLGTGYGQLFIPSDSYIGQNIITDRGFIIEASDLIYVSVRMNSENGAQAGAMVSKGLSALGTEFRIGSYTNESPGADYLNFVSVMATEDDTNITFDDLPSELIIENYSGTFPINATLDKGESYIIATNSSKSAINKDGLIGTLVSSDKPIVVNCGSANGSFGGGGGRDYGIDQIVGADKIGSEYIFVKGDGNNEWENVLIVPHTNGTTLSINGGAPITISERYYLIEGDQYSSDGNMYVKTSNNVFAYQGIGATSGEANQGMFFVPPLDCETRGNVDKIAQIDKIGNTSYQGGVTIVTKQDATVKINGSPITQTPNPVTGKPSYVTYKVLGLTGDTSVQCDDELYCAYFNYNGNATSGSFYSGFPTAPEINFDADFVTLGNCIDNVTLEAANMGAFESIQWYYNDGSGGGFIPTNNKTKFFTPTFPSDGPFSAGIYKIIGITCKGDEIHSDEIPVGICPDDTDDDGIIDNIDIDNDNDGIINCEESYGDQNINLSNTSSGSLPVGGYSYTGEIKAIGVSSNNITGDSNGTITSNVDSKNGIPESSVRYELTFNKNLNLLIESNSALTDQDEFIIQVTNDKTITLIDPDDQLLIDTNYDGVYESGITQFSSFEIHFKIKDASLATSTYSFKFAASMVNSFSYTHLNNSETNSGNAAFKIRTTCVPRDSDNDGIADEFDNDSDNDGIPDIAESTGTLKILSGTDSNNDGLDDVFNGTTSPIDSDNDGVFDYLDIDSDNDGIYDLEESGSGLPDTNFNGVIDNISTIGLNGWDDNAEETPDDGKINYTITNTDSDVLFNYIDSDSDGDMCTDVIEAGFTPDPNNNEIISGTGTDSTNGKVNGSDGYSSPNSDYITAGLITISQQPLDTEICALETAIITIETNAVDSYQWQLSTDGTNWTDIVDDLIYSNSKTNELTITATPLSYHNHKYRVVLNKNGNSCGLISDEMTLTVNPIPIIVSSVQLVQCDNDSNDGISFFNLNEVNILILPNATTETFKFYTDPTTDPLFLISDSDAISYEAADNSKVYSRVTINDGCFSVAEITLIVEPTQLNTSFQENFYECDDYIDNNDRDGISTFDFSSVTDKIYTELNTDATRVSIKYYENQSDALAEENEVNPSNYRNTNYPIIPPILSHQIYVRIDSYNENACIGLGSHVNLHVKTLPFANPVTIERQCDDDADGLFIFNTSQVESTVLGSQSLIDVSVSYFDSFGNPLKDSNGNLIASPFPNTFSTTTQTITIHVSNNTTLACYDETTLEFIVDKSPIAYPVTIAPACGNKTNDRISDFDTSTIQAAILGGQTDMEVHYYDQSGTELPSPLPNPFTTATQTITVEVINPLNSICTATTSFDFIVNPLPNFEIIEPEPLCITEPPSSITLEVYQDNPQEILDYEWSDTNGTVLSTNETYNVSNPGTYYITLTKTDGTLCARTKSILVNPSATATITQDDIIVADDTDNKTITIITDNLGTGDYEFALDDPYFYQDEPFFNYVEAGIHTIFIQDKNNCGVSQIEVFVIGFPKFMTPNNDGFNDTWNVLGIDTNKYPTAKIYIFDRFGKLISLVDSDSEGWDGYYNDEPLPSTDYWFSVELIDANGASRIKKGHFTLIRK